MNRIILLSVDDAWIKRGGETAGASGSANAVTLRMTFDSNWDGTTKTVYFTDALGENSVKVLLGLDALVADNTYDVPVPGEAMEYPGQATVTVVGESQGRVITTQAAKFRVLDAMVPDSAGNSKPITPDEASQLQAQIDALEEIFVVNREQAQAAADEAESAKNAVLDALDNLPPGAVLVIDDLTTGGKTAALSAEQGKILEETKADRQLSNLDTPQAALVSLGAGVRPNLMVNSHFVGGGSQQGGGQLPINLRGQTEYAGVTQLISRWKSTNANLKSFTIKKDCISLTVGESRAYFRQLTDPGFEWKQGIYTLSALVRGSGIIFLNIASANTSNSFSGLTAYQLTDQFTICSFSLDTRTISGWDPGQFYMAINAGTTVDIAAMKAEFGEGQTLGYQDSEDSWKLFLQPESDYATQLLECQRYSRIISTKGVDVHLSGFITGNGLYFWAVLPLSVPMRTTPVVTFTGNVTVRTISGYATDNSGSNYLTPKSIEVSADRDNQILTLRFTFDKALGENNTPGTLSLSGSSPGTQIILDANL